MVKNPDKYNDDQLERQIAIVNNEICDKKGDVKAGIDHMIKEIHRTDNKLSDLEKIEVELDELKD